MLNNRMAAQTPAQTFDLAALGGVVEQPLPEKQEFNLAALGGVVESEPQRQDSTLTTILQTFMIYPQVARFTSWGGWW